MLLPSSLSLSLAGIGEERSTAFQSSLTSDLAAVSSVCEGLSEEGVRSFISALSDCRGTILTSGIGQHTPPHCSTMYITSGPSPPLTDCCNIYHVIFPHEQESREWLLVVSLAPSVQWVSQPTLYMQQNGYTEI